MKHVRNQLRPCWTAVPWLLLFMVLGMTGCGQEQGAQNASSKKKAPMVATEFARKGPIAQQIELTGEAVAVESVVIAATVEGPISYCPWREGDRIEKAGEKLIEISRDMYRAEVNAAEAAMEVARAKLEDLKAGTRPEELAKAREEVRQLEESTAFAQNDLARITRLVDSGSLPAEALDKARVEYVAEQAQLATAKEHLRMLGAGPTRTAIAVQEAVVKESQAKLDLAKARLRECVINAPFAGIIMDVHVRSGDLATPRSPLLEMYDPESLVIRFSVPEAQASTVRTGLRVKATLDALSGRAFNAEITRLYPQLDETMRTRTVEAKVIEPAEIVPHMFARLKLELKRAENAVLVPSEAVLTAATGEHYVFVTDQGKAQRRVVEIGIEQDKTTQILGGLKSGQRVVVAGQGALRDGQPIRTPGEGGPGSGKSPVSTQPKPPRLKPGEGSGR